MFQYLKRAFIIIFVLVFLGIVYIFFFPVILQKDFQIYVKPGTNVRQFGYEISSENLLFSSPVFRVVVRVLGADRQLQIGEYRLERGATIYFIAKQIEQGNVYQYPFAIIDGWNFDQLMDALNQNPHIQHTLQGKTPEEIAQLLNISRQTPEGLLLPDTYFYPLDATDMSILNRSYQDMLDYLNQVWPDREKDLPYQSQYRALIVASLIEKETSSVDEMPIIADVIRKRLTKWMPLQIDSAVIYGIKIQCQNPKTKKWKLFCKSFDGQLKDSGLKMDTPYNTYMHYELPPTPISIPSKEAIYAALHPAQTPYWYFVAKKGEKTHVFSATLEEQQQQIGVQQVAASSS